MRTKLRRYLFPALALLAVLFAPSFKRSPQGLVLAGLGFPDCGGNTTVNVTQQVHVSSGPQPTNPAGCQTVTLSGAPVDGGVVLGIAPADGSYRLSVDGADAGPASDGQTVTLTSGTHHLQLTSGACQSNALTVVVP